MNATESSLIVLGLSRITSAIMRCKVNQFLRIIYERNH